MFCAKLHTYNLSQLSRQIYFSFHNLVKINGNACSCSTCTFFKALLSVIHVWKELVLIRVHVCTCVYSYKPTEICLAAYKPGNKLKSWDFR